MLNSIWERVDPSGQDWPSRGFDRNSIGKLTTNLQIRAENAPRRPMDERMSNMTDRRLNDKMNDNHMIV